MSSCESQAFTKPFHQTFLTCLVQLQSDLNYHLASRDFSRAPLVFFVCFPFSSFTSKNMYFSFVYLFRVEFKTTVQLVLNLLSTDTFMTPLVMKSIMNSSLPSTSVTLACRSANGDHENEMQSILLYPNYL